MAYILYVAQEANFESRTMLIPMEEFLKVRQDDYHLLKHMLPNKLLNLIKIIL